VLAAALGSLREVETKSSADHAGALARARTRAVVRVLRGIGGIPRAVAVARAFSPWFPRTGLSPGARPGECVTAKMNARATGAKGRLQPPARTGLTTRV